MTDRSVSIIGRMLEESPTNPGSRAWESCRIVSRSSPARATASGAGWRAGSPRKAPRSLVAELNEESGPAVVDELASDFGADARFVRTDVGREGRQPRDGRRRGRHAWGTVDILVNNAWGGGSLGRVEFKTDEAMDHALRVGFLGPFWAMQATFPIMKAKGLRPHRQHLLAERRERAHGYRRLQHGQGSAAHADAVGSTGVGADGSRRQRDLPRRTHRPRPAPCSPKNPELESAGGSVDPHGAPRRSRRPTSRRSRCSSPATTAAT